MTLEVAVLVSVGRHPASGRARRAEGDARAVELALRLPGAKRHLIHAGDPGAAALRDYLGMGVAVLTVLALPADADPVPALADHLAGIAPDLVLAGQCAEGGEDSGLVPYCLAQALGYALAPAIAELEVRDGRAHCLQALPRGRRRALEAPLPLLATVSPAAPGPRMSAFGPARRGRVEVRPAASARDPAPAGWEERPARRRPKRLRRATGASALERVRAVTEVAAGAGVVLERPTPEAAARAIYDYLVAESMVAV